MEPNRMPTRFGSDDEGQAQNTQQGVAIVVLLV